MTKLKGSIAFECDEGINGEKDLGQLIFSSLWSTEKCLAFLSHAFNLYNVK